MRFRIHRGTQEIGGTCVEIEAGAQRVVLDIGLPLDVADADAMSLHPVPGFQTPDPSLLGVLISHPHPDHYGLAHRLPDETTFLIGAAAQSILEVAADFTPGGLKLKTVRHLVDLVPIILGPFTITPFLVDHSAYDSYAVLVEADGKRLFYSGDFRAHGRKSGLVERLISHPPQGVGALLMEGTTIGRANSDVGFASEDDLVDRFIELFDQTDGLALVCVSGQNIDRIVTLYKACCRARRQFIIDVYAAHILRATGNRNLPQADWGAISVFLPAALRARIKRDGSFELANVFRPFRIFPEVFADEAARSVMLFRPSMIRDLDRIPGLKIGRLIHSMWDGYLNDARNKPLLDWLARHSIPLDQCHTSGHADLNDLRRIRQAFPNAAVIPIHTSDRVGYAEALGPVRLVDDGEWVDV